MSAIKEIQRFLGSPIAFKPLEEDEFDELLTKVYDSGASTSLAMMEDLGEDYVGYTDTIRRSKQFGTSHLRFARALEPGFVVTVEPGIYFIPGLIDQWKAQGKFSNFIDYEQIEAYRDFGGIRIEDNVLVHDDGRQVLGKPIAKTVDAVEALSTQSV